MNSNSLHVHILFDGAQGRCFRMRSGRRSVLPHASETEGIWDRKMDTGYGGENSMEGGSHSANRQVAAAAAAAAADSLLSCFGLQAPSSRAFAFSSMFDVKYFSYLELAAGCCWVQAGHNTSVYDTLLY